MRSIFAVFHFYQLGMPSVVVYNMLIIRNDIMEWESRTTGGKKRSDITLSKVKAIKHRHQSLNQYSSAGRESYMWPNTVTSSTTKYLGKNVLPCQYLQYRMIIIELEVECASSNIHLLDILQSIMLWNFCFNLHWESECGKGSSVTMKCMLCYGHK